MRNRPPRVVVRRAIWRMLLLALAGIPLLFLVVDHLWGIFGIFDRLGSWAYGTRDPEPFEVRDDLLAALAGLIGVALIGFGLKELLIPRRVLVADETGLTARLNGPLRPPVTLGWARIRDLESAPRRLVVHLVDGDGVPEDPWGATRTDQRTLTLRAGWWDTTPDRLIDEVARLRLPDAARSHEEERQLEEARIHAAAMEIISGAAVVADPTVELPAVEASAPAETPAHETPVKAIPATEAPPEPPPANDDTTDRT